MSAVAAKLIEECKSRGISLRPGEGGKLKVSPPPEWLPVELREELKRHKPEVLALLASTSYRALYATRAESVKEDCFAINPFTLIDRYPELWGEMVTLDTILSRMEKEGATAADYGKALDRLCEVVRQAQALMKMERRQDRQ